MLDKSDLSRVSDFKPWCYYQDLETECVYSIRQVDKANCVAVQCFVHRGDQCEIVELMELRGRNMKFYANNFQTAFNRYWRENRSRLILQNKAEIRNISLPKNMKFEK